MAPSLVTRCYSQSLSGNWTIGSVCCNSTFNLSGTSRVVPDGGDSLWNFIVASVGACDCSQWTVRCVAGNCTIRHCNS